MNSLSQEVIDPRAFRNALGNFATGIAVVTAGQAGQDPVAMTVSSFNSVSLDPPLVLFSIGRNAPSLPALLDAPAFAVNVLNADQASLSDRFSGGRPDKWAGLAPTTGTTGCPLIGPSLATFECRHFATYEGGDHVIVVGEVLNFEAASECAPLIFFRGNYHAVAQPSSINKGSVQ